MRHSLMSLIVRAMAAPSGLRAAVSQAVTASVARLRSTSSANRGPEGRITRRASTINTAVTVR